MDYKTVKYLAIDRLAQLYNRTNLLRRDIKSKVLACTDYIDLVHFYSQFKVQWANVYLTVFQTFNTLINKSGISEYAAVPAYQSWKMTLNLNL